MLKPNLQKKIVNRQIDQTVAKRQFRSRQLSIGQNVVVRNYTGPRKWLPGTVRAQTGPLSYEIEVGPNKIWRRHIDELRTSGIQLNDQVNKTEDTVGEETDATELEEPTPSTTPTEDSVEPTIDAATNTAPVQVSNAATGYLVRLSLLTVIRPDHINNPTGWVLTLFLLNMMLRYFPKRGRWSYI